MYIPIHFVETDQNILHAFIRENSFATIVFQTSNGLDAHHVPMLLGDDNVLRGHIAKANPIWKNYTNPIVLVIFQGENSYISPSFYPSKQIDGKAVPTWNYSAVHANGEIVFIHDKDWLLDTVSKLSDFHEKNFAMPWKIADAPPQYIAQMLHAIVGFEIKIETIEGKFKLSQNHSQSNRDGVRIGLEAIGKNPSNLVR